MKRVAIVGPPGAGKSTLARKLGDKTGLPVIHMDTMFLDPKHDYLNDKEEWFKRSTEFISSSFWIADGNYSSSYKQRFDAADTIILMQASRHKSLVRIIKRRWEYRNKQRPEMDKTWKEKINKDFLLYAWNFPTERAEKLHLALQQHQDKVIVLSNLKQVRKFLEML